MNDHPDAGQMLSNYLTQAQSLANQNRFDEALQKLQDAYKLTGLTENDIGQIEAVEQRVEEIRQERVQALIGKLETLLDRKPEELTQADLDAGQNTLALLQNIHPNPVDLEPLLERWQDHYRRTQTWLDLEATRRKLDELWKAPYILLSRYDKALSIARQKAQAYPDEPMAQELLAEAERRRQEAYRQEGKLVTGEVVADFRNLHRELLRLRDAGSEFLPWYEIGTREIEGSQVRVPVQTGEAEAEAAIKQLVSLAGIELEKKVAEYIQRAEAELRASPETVYKYIEKAISDFGEFISDIKKTELETYRDQTIKPALEKRWRADQLVQAAETIAEKDIEKAWDYLRQAAEVDPYAPAIDKARDQLRPRLITHLKELLRQADEKRQVGDFKNAEGMASHVREIAEHDEALREIAQQVQDLVQKCDADQSFLKFLEDGAGRIKELVDTNLAEAIQALANLEAKVAGRPECFRQALQGVRYTVQTRQSLEALLVGWERRFQAIDPTRLDKSEAINQAIDELDHLAAEVRQAIAERGREPKLTDFQVRIEVRRRFLQGRLDWEAGLYQRAKDAWEWFEQPENAEEVEKDDISLSLARKWLKQAEDATAVTQAIEDALDYRENGEYKQAIKRLEEWRTKASPKQQEVRDLYRQIEAEWVEQLEKDIEKLIADLERHPVYAVLVEKVNQLAFLQPEKARNYQYEQFPRIYEEWGNQAQQIGQYSQAEEYYETAAKWGGGEARIRVETKLRQARRQQVYKEIERLIADGQRDQARQKLTEWVRQVPDVESLCWLADLFLEDEEHKRAGIYIQQAERHLERADREKNPARAGLAQAEEITEWQLRLEALSIKTQAVADLSQAKLRITERLQPRASLREYRLAQETKGGLIEQLRQTEQDMHRRENEHPLLSILPQETQERVHRAWREVRRWLGEQVRVNAGISEWYASMERKLLNELRNSWNQTQAPDEGLAFLDAPPAKNLRDRWEVGLKIRFLFREDNAGETTLREITRALGRLRGVAKQLTDDIHGPEYDLEHKHLEPLDSLSHQLQWSENVQGWGALLQELLGGYTWVTEKEHPEDGAGIYQDARRIYEEVANFREALLGLRSALQRAKGQLEQAIAAGNDVRHGWEHVPWSALIVHILRSPRTPPPVEGGKELSRDYWQNLEHDDMDVRWAAWRKAAEIFQRTKIADRYQEAPWEVINPLIVQAGIEEQWAEVGAPLQEYLVRFGRHRAVSWLFEEKNQAEEKRNQLVLAVIVLYALVQAEEFHAALAQIGWIVSLDGENRYGFRNGYLIKEPNRLSWDDLKESLQARQRQWEQFQAWWAEVESSALGPWQAESRRHVIELVRKAAFEEAIQLSQDALEGAQAGGRTNRLGGGLALEPLLQHLESCPPELRQPLSYRLRRALAEADSWHHDAQQAVDELRLWLQGIVGQHRPTDIPEPIEELRRRFSDGKEALENALTVLEGRWWPWQRRGKEDQREYCLELLADLRRTAPDWPGLEYYEQRIRKA